MANSEVVTPEVELNADGTATLVVPGQNTQTMFYKVYLEGINEP